MFVVFLGLLQIAVDSQMKNCSERAHEHLPLLKANIFEKQLYWGDNTCLRGRHGRYQLNSKNCGSVLTVR